MAALKDILFIHEGKAIDPAAPIGLLPMGLLSMADLLEQHGMKARIVHHAVERKLDPGFDLFEFIRASGAGIVGLDLHWHQQSRSVIELASGIKKRCPGTSVVLGGYTASAFDREIMETFDAVDFIIRGDGELPMLELAGCLGRGGRLSGVPNLTYRDGTGVKRSRTHHVNSEDDLGRFRFTNFELLRNHETYNQQGLMEGEIAVRGARRPGIFYCNCGRGCPYNCLFCGGSRKAQQIIAGRRRPVYRPAAAMLRDLERMRQYNLDTWYNTFHPTPDESYFLELFSEIRKRGLGISMIHECLHIPSEAFIEAFAAAFGSKSRMDFVLLTGSEPLRRKNKENYFGNAELLQCLDRLQDRGIRADLCFLTGLPFETKADMDRSLEFIRSVRARYDNLSLNAEILAIEPCAPMNLDPEGCGIVSHARTFGDYHRGHARPGFVGYRPGGMSAARAAAVAGSYREAFAGKGGGPGPRRKAKEGPKLVQLHAVNLWDGGMRYGLGAPSLISYASSLPDLKTAFRFEQVTWKAEAPGEADPTADEVAARVIEAAPAVAGFTVVSWSEKIFFDALRRIKKEVPDIVIALGGPLASAYGPDLLRTLPEADYLACGYGELAFASMLRHLSGRGGKLPGGLYARRGSEVAGRMQKAADVLPPHGVPSPYRAGLVSAGASPTMHVEWARGCPGRCAYCSWGNRAARMLQASRERVMDDVAWALERDVKEVTLNNSAINFSTRRLAELCGAMAEADPGRRIAFTGFLRYEHLDGDQVEILGRVRWKSLIMGLQTDDVRGLRAIGRPPFDRKKFERSLSSLAAFTRPAVQVITALPGDTFQKFSRRLAYLSGMDCDVTVFPLQVTPGTPMWNERKRLGIEPDAEHHYWVYETPTLSAADHLRCIESAARKLEETRNRGGRTRESHGVSAGRGFEEQLRRKTGKTGRKGDVLRVQLHDGNVYDGGMHFGLGVPFLMAHCMGKPKLREKVRLEHVEWRLRVPGRPDPACDDIVASIADADPQVAGFSLQPWSSRLFLDVIAALKQRRPDIQVVVGGPNAMLLGKDLMRDVQGIDYLVPGEGELAFAGLLEALARGGPGARRGVAGVKGLVYRRGGRILSTGRSPLPAGSLDYCGSPAGEGLITLRPEEGSLYFEWTRGCPNRCAYCSWHRYSHTFRRFSRKRIADDIGWARDKGFDSILICDSAINYHNGLLGELCAVLTQSDPGRTMAFSAFVHHYLLTQEQINLMRPVRWHRIMTGLQTDDAFGLKVLGRRRFDRKRFEWGMKSLRPLSVPYVEIMSGVPGDTVEKFRARLDYLLDLGCRVSMFPLQATPGTKIWKMRRALGLKLDPERQHVIRETPTLPYERYRELIADLMGLGLPNDELEIAGYEFMELRDEEGRAAAAGRRDRDEMRRRLAAVADAFRDISRRAGGRTEAFTLDGVEEAALADISAWRLTFTHGTLTISIDAFRKDDVSLPVAAGKALAFCPHEDAKSGRGKDVDAREAAMLLCRALAEIDKRT